MKEYYKKKMEYHFEHWQAALDCDDPDAVKMHEREYLNYSEMYNR